ncbi:hypothetical protein L9F63_022976, partial [Diploptera punctata]
EITDIWLSLNEEYRERTRALRLPCAYVIMCALSHEQTLHVDANLRPSLTETVTACFTTDLTGH